MSASTSLAVYAAIGWDGDGFIMATAGLSPEQEWRAASVGEVCERLSALHDSLRGRLRCVIESTDGMIDGTLLRAGMTVLRADPTMLPDRAAGAPVLASLPARELAAAAARRPDALVPLALSSGTLTGRTDVEPAVAHAAGDLARLAAAGRSMHSGPRGTLGSQRYIALTFDDGPHPPYTEQVLDVLARYDVPATFFCVGLHAQTHRSLLREMGAAGHQLANHTWSHALLTDLDAPQLRAQLDRTDDVLAAAAPDQRRPPFRPPYGVVNRTAIDTLTRADPERTMVFWDVATNDWACPGPDAIATDVLAGAQPGSIVLLHDGGGDRSDTVAALPRIVETLLERNYTFVTVDAAMHPPRR